MGVENLLFDGVLTNALNNKNHENNILGNGVLGNSVLGNSVLGNNSHGNSTHSSSIYGNSCHGDVQLDEQFVPRDNLTDSV